MGNGQTSADSNQTRQRTVSDQDKDRWLFLLKIKINQIQNIPLGINGSNYFQFEVAIRKKRYCTGQFPETC